MSLATRLDLGRLSSRRRAERAALVALPAAAGGQAEEGAPRWRELEILLRATDDEGMDAVDVLARFDLARPDFSVFANLSHLDDRVERLQGSRPIVTFAAVVRALDAAGRPYRDLFSIREDGLREMRSGYYVARDVGQLVTLCRVLVDGKGPHWSVSSKAHADGRLTLWLDEHYWAITHDKYYGPKLYTGSREHRACTLDADASTDEAARVAAELAGVASNKNAELSMSSERYTRADAEDALAAEQTGAEERLAREARARELEATLRTTLAAHGMSVTARD